MENESSVNHEKDVPSRKNVFSRIWKIFSTCIIVVVAALAVLLGGVRLIGFTPYAVLSGSMTPKYSVGSLVYVQKMDPSQIKEGDVITFVAGKNKVVVTHRVVEADHAERRFYTKGDANKDKDASPVIYENVLGRVRFSLPLIGYLSIALTNQTGRFIVLAAFFFLCFLLLLPELVKAFRKK